MNETIVCFAKRVFSDVLKGVALNTFLGECHQMAICNSMPITQNYFGKFVSPIEADM